MTHSHLQTWFAFSLPALLALSLALTLTRIQLSRLRRKWDSARREAAQLRLDAQKRKPATVYEYSEERRPKS